MIQEIKKKYSVGPLMYTPALNNKIANTVLDRAITGHYSLALCLEDTISTDLVDAAEQQIVSSLSKLYSAYKEGTNLPDLFIRVREPEQTIRVFEKVKDYQDIFTGFIFPKYTESNAKQYNEGLLSANEAAHKKLYMMPILESKDIIDFRSRNKVLGSIKEQIDSMNEFVLNVRVGGNDFSNEFAARRHIDETIYDILPISQLLGDILTVFSREYVVSGPVWEFFSSENDEWKTGLQQELKLDILNGFVGKTVIHPNQIPVVNDALMVSIKDFEDAKAILNWDSSGLQVGKSYGGERMNEVRTNYYWAQKTMLLADIYGVKKDDCTSYIR